MAIKRKLVYFVCILVSLALLDSGCSSLREKFIRKPKNEKEDQPIQRYQPVHQYDVHPSLDLYTKRYIFWKQWHRELLNVFRASSNKKRTVAIEQTLSNLIDMQSMITDEKAKELEPYIDKITEIEREVKKKAVTSGNKDSFYKVLATFEREIRTKFSYNKMGGSILNDFRYKQEN